MITIKLDYINNQINKIEIKGHANAGKYGQDIVCSAVSACVIGGINNLNGFNKNEIEIKEGYVLIDIKHTLDEHDIVTLETIIRQLETISESNSKHIQIVRKEY